ncbi:uncharacterized protein FIESC28_10586 [Fusarium coffeatum]|uniref:F-box domain-containing protein n=1 Tax=Fusarium coffeatum TaxID=231269 RepID=A0A366QU50_9HYPO|nr:uncharacterized protein FIESC28_10586 [Fusarium coffeatum]RBR07505.1 hypothetical protein FIESC28_10586 [Fusarium coffeatum]
MEAKTATTGTGWSPPRLPNEIYCLIISQVNDFDDSSRKRTLLALVRIGEGYLYSKSPSFFDEDKAAEFRHSLRLQPRRALYVTSLIYNYDDLADFSMQCRNLQELKLWSTLTLTGDLEQACKNWGSTLRMLKVRSVVELSDWIVQIMPHMTALTTLILDRACTIGSKDIQAIAESKAPLQQITLAGLYLPQDEAAEESEGETDEETNDAIANMITTHSSTLRHIGLENAKVAPHVLESCKKAKKLRTLDIELAYSPSEAEVDDLLDACPHLSDYTGIFSFFSLREDEWKMRPMAEVPEATFDF